MYNIGDVIEHEMPDGTEKRFRVTGVVELYGGSKSRYSVQFESLPELPKPLPFTPGYFSFETEREEDHPAAFWRDTELRASGMYRRDDLNPPF